MTSNNHSSTAPGGKLLLGGGKDSLPVVIPEPHRRVIGELFNIKVGGPDEHVALLGVPEAEEKMIIHAREKGAPYRNTMSSPKKVLLMPGRHKIMILADEVIALPGSTHFFLQGHHMARIHKQITWGLAEAIVSPSSTAL